MISLMKVIIKHTARRKDHQYALLPLLDDMHVVWMESEKARWVQEGLITVEIKDKLATGLGFGKSSSPYVAKCSDLIRI